MDNDLNFYKEIVDSIGDYVLVVDRHYRIVFTNRSLLERCGSRENDVVEKHCYEFSHHCPFPCRIEDTLTECPHEIVFKTGKSTSITHPHKLPDGTELIFDITASPIRDKNGEIIYMIEVMRDVTMAKRVTDELRETREMFHAIAKTATDAIVVIDDRGMITFWNPSAERMFGYKEDEALGKELHLIFAPEMYHKAYRSGIKVFGETGRGNVIGRTLEFTATKKNGTEFPIEVSTSAIRVKGRWHAVGIIRDISERMKLNEDLKKRIKELEEFYEIAVARELRMIELKEEIDRLKKGIDKGKT
jgi:PAS domain S-box-containing protein